MSVDADYLYNALLAHNYLPMVKEHRDETPALFSTESFSPEIADQLNAHQNDSADKNFRNRDGFDQIEYRTTRFNNVTRLMHIPHPAPYARLCRTLFDNWQEEPLVRICMNESSKVKPEQHDDGRIFVSDEYEDSPAGRVVVMEKDKQVAEVMATLADAIGSYYYAEADVSSCFPSIYSHAIPWALVGHDQAKRDRNVHKKWFNQIDKYQRLLKRNETLGVPVGPATSNIACEVVLYPVDEELREYGYRFDRYIDDYRCYCDTHEQAERFIRDLERILSRYLLSINAKKVSIERLPKSGKAQWVLELQNRLPKARLATPADVVHCLDYAVSLHRQEPDGSVLKYAARALSRKIAEDSVDVFCRYILMLGVHYPIVLPILADVVRRHKALLKPEHLRVLLQRQVEYRRSDAIGWTLYLYGLTEIDVEEKDAEQIVKTGDCMSMASLLAINQHQAQVCDFIRGLMRSQRHELDRYWILVHELGTGGDLPAGPVADYAEKSGLALLASHEVSFLRSPQDAEQESHERDVVFEDEEIEREDDLFEDVSF